MFVRNIEQKQKLVLVVCIIMGIVTVVTSIGSMIYADVRISKSEIINLRFVKRLDLSITGTIGIQLKTGETAYVSRRYVNRIKSILGL